LYAHSPDDGTAVPKHIQQILYLTEIYGEIVSLCLQNYCSSYLMTMYHMGKNFRLPNSLYQTCTQKVFMFESTWMQWTAACVYNKHDVFLRPLSA